MGNTRLFQGREYDWATGLYNYRSRYMDPQTGRFTTRDPLGAWGDLLHLGNGYSFLNNNPWSLVDPFGLEANANKSEFLDELWAALKSDTGSNIAEFVKGFVVDGAGGTFMDVIKLVANLPEVVGAIKDLVVALHNDAGGVLGSMKDDFVASLSDPRALGALTFEAMATVLSGGALAVVGKGSRIARLLDKLPSRNIMKKRRVGGVDVTPTRHSVDQKISRGVRSVDELDALKNPLDVRPVRVDQLGRPSQRFIGRKAEVVINPQTRKIVSVNPTSTRKAERLLRRLDDE